MSILLALAVTTAVPQPQASIPFFSSISSPDWRVDGDKGLWIRGNTKQWYYATLMGPCPRLKQALGIGFRTGPLDELDKFSQIVVEGSTCPIVSLTKSDAPPRKVKSRS